MPYGVAIQDAIASGDVDKMKQTATDAQSYLDQHGEIGDGLKQLHAEIARVGGGGSGSGGAGGAVFQPLYGVAIRAAIKSGDADQMKAVAQQAQDWLKQADDVRTALTELQNAQKS